MGTGAKTAVVAELVAITVMARATRRAALVEVVDQRQFERTVTRPSRSKSVSRDPYRFGHARNLDPHGNLGRLAI